MAPSSFFHGACTSPFPSASSSIANADPSPIVQTAEAVSSPFGSSNPFVFSSSKPSAVPSPFAQNAGFVPSSSAADTKTTGFAAFSSNQSPFNRNGNFNVNKKAPSPSFRPPPSSPSPSHEAQVIGWSPFSNVSSKNPPATTSSNKSIFNSSSATLPNHFQFPQGLKPETLSGGEGLKQQICPECGHTFEEQLLGSRVVAYSPIKESGDRRRLLTSISAMAAYTTKTHEELRWEDYQLEGKSKSSSRKNSFGTLDQRPQWVVPGMQLLGFTAVPRTIEAAPSHSSFSALSSQKSCDAPFVIAPLYVHPSLGMPSPPIVLQLCDMFRQL